MKFDRNNLNPVGFIRPAVKNSRHARISHEFIESIGDGDALVVYVILRDCPPRHRWKTGTVIGRLRKIGIKMGRQRVERAMARLNREGWIRYIDLVMPDGQKRGSIVEVEYQQLSPTLKGDRRRIQIHRGEAFQMFEHDGTEVTEDAYKPRNVTTALNKAVIEGQARNGQNQEGPLLQNPEDRAPGEGSSGEQYKGHGDVEEPLAPSGKGEDMNPFPGFKSTVSQASVEAMRRPGSVVSTRSDGENSEANCNNVHFTSGGRSLAIDWQEVREKARLAKDDYGKCEKYEVLMAQKVLPALLEPPSDHGKWTNKAALDWCRNSEKGRFILSLAEEDDWTPDLARRFVKLPSRWSVGRMKQILLARIFAHCTRVPLVDILSNDAEGRGGSSEEPNWWSKLLRSSKESLGHDRLRFNFFLSSITDSKSDEESIEKAVNWLKNIECEYRWMSNENANGDWKFDWLLGQHRSHQIGKLDFREIERFKQHRATWAPAMTRLVAESLSALIIARANFPYSEEIWGIDWEEARERHVRFMEALKIRANLHGLEAPKGDWLFWFGLEELVIPEKLNPKVAKEMAESFGIRYLPS